MFCFDTSAFINGQRYHYPIDTFPTVWATVEKAMREGVIVSPHQVLDELKAIEDHISDWARKIPEAFVDPSPAVQSRVGELQVHFPNYPARDGADPFLITEAEERGLTVVTYEGVSADGSATKNALEKLPGICQQVGVPLCTLPTALAGLGVTY